MTLFDSIKLLLLLFTTLLSLVLQTKCETITGALAAQLCRNPSVTSATKTPYGVICLIPEPAVNDMNLIEKRQQEFVRSLPKILRYEQNDNFNQKFVPQIKTISNQFDAQTNQLSKRSIFSNWFQKIYDSFYKTIYKSFQKLQSSPQQPNGQQNLPQQQQQQQPHTQQTMPIGDSFGAGHPLLGAADLPIQKPDNLFGQEFPSQAMIPMPSNSDSNPEYIPLQAYTSGSTGDDVKLNEPVIDEQPLGEAVLDWPQYNYGSIRQLATYLQSIQHKINRQKSNNFDTTDDDIEFGGNANHDNNNDQKIGANKEKDDIVLPLYSDSKVWDKDESESRTSETVRHVYDNPRKMVFEFTGYKRKLDCKGRFKPLKTIESETEMSPKMLSSLSPKSRRKRYIELDYSQMQFRKLPIWFNKNTDNTVPEAIVEVKPRSLFKWQQPMLGWSPIVPHEMVRKDVFLKRTGDPLSGETDQEQVESRHSNRWYIFDKNGTETANNDSESAESVTLEALKNLDSSKSSVVIDRRNYANNRALNYLSKDMSGSDKKQTNSKYESENLVFKRRPDSSLSSYDNQVTTTPKMTTDSQESYALSAGIKAVEVENVGEDVAKAKSLDDITSIPGAVIKPIDPKLTDILLKVLSHNPDFTQKRITNAYFLEFPKMPEYKPSPITTTTRSPRIQKIVSKEAIFKPTFSEPPVQTRVKLPNGSSYQLDYDKDIQVTDADYEYGEIVCANKISGAVADVRKGCQMYYQCTQYTIDTYVCPRGTRFDDQKQYCLPTNQVICGKYS